MKKWLVGLVVAWAQLACAYTTNFLPGQILHASDLNSAFAAVVPYTGGIFTGAVTIPTLTVNGVLNGSSLVLSTPLGATSGGTGMTTPYTTGAVLVGATGGGLTTVSTISAGLPLVSAGSGFVPTWSVLGVAGGGTACNAGSGQCVDNISGFSGTGFLTRTGSATYAFQSLVNGVTLGNLAQIGANTLLGNAGAAVANVAALTVPSCSTAGSALQWASGGGLGCNTAVDAATLLGATWASPPAAGYGSTTPEPVAATTVAVKGSANDVTLAGGATTVKPSITTSGTDAAVGLAVKVQGATSVTIGNGSGDWFHITGPATPANYLTASGASTTGNVSLIAAGSDTDIGISLTPKGLGNVKITSGGAQLPVTTVAGLPVCNSAAAGTMAAVSDATAPTYNGALTGGGTVGVPVYCNGTSWTSH